MTVTSDEFVDGVKSRISMPASQALLTDADIRKFGDKVIKAHLVPLLVSMRQDFFVTSSTTATVASQDSYAIPYRAIGRGLRDLKIVDSSSTVRDLALIQIEDCHRFNQTASVHSFYFKGDKVVLIPTPIDALASLQFWWEEPPQPMCAVASAALITAISSGSITLSNLPSTMTATVTVDFVKGKSGNATIGMDVAIVSASSPTLSFSTSDIPSDLEVGDYVSLAQTSPVVQLPNECLPLLETRTAQRILRSIGDYDGANALADDVKDEEKNLKALLEPRIQGEPTIIMNRNGLLRGRRFFARRGLLY